MSSSRTRWIDVVLPGAKVVGLTRLASPVESEPVAANDVPNVGEIAAGFQVPHVDDRVLLPLLDGRELLREIRRDEDVPTARSVVVETTGANHLRSEAHEVLVAEIVLSDLADRVGRERPQGVGLANGELVLVDHSVLLARAGDLDPGIDPHGTNRFEQIQLPEDVGAQRLRGRVPGRRYEALRREVEDAVRPHPVDERGDRALIAQIALLELYLRFDAPDVLRPAAPAHRAEHLGSGVLGKNVFGQMASREAGDSRDQYAQG